LRAAFEAAPIGKTMLDGERAIVRSNTAFARLVGREPAELEGVQIVDLCHPEDRDRVSAALDRVAEADVRPASVAGESLDLRVLPAHGSEVWVGLVASSIEPADLSAPFLLAQWVDLSSRRRAEEARAELLMEHAARTHAEAMAERLSKLQALSGAIESLSLQRVLAELAVRLAELFDAEAAEVEIVGQTGEPVTFRAEHGTARRLDPGKLRAALEHGHEVPIVIEGVDSGVLRIRLPAGRSFTPTERSLMQDAAERAALGIQRAQLHEREHQVAVELQRGLLPKQLPAIDGLELAAHYEAAGAEVGGDWYDAFTLPGGRLGVVLGDVAGRGVPAASSMGQLRSVTRAFALADDGFLTPAEMLTRLNRHQLALGQTELFTVVYAIIDPAEGTISWATAGHPPPLVRNGEGWTSYLEGGEGLMGIEDIVYRDLRAPLDEGSIVIFYTDGLIERRGESLDVGLERLADALGSGPEVPAELCEYVIEQMRPAGRELHDDVTALLVKLV
jgi:PAS domain S-box-containing protein